MKKLLFIIFLISLTFLLTAVETGDLKTGKNCCGKMNMDKCGKMKMGKKMHVKMSGNMFPSYMSVQKALAADNSVAAKNAFKSLMKSSEGDIKVLSEKGMKANDLEGMRANFKDISNKIAMMKYPEGYGTVYCPMAKAWWIQKKGKISNPYFGKKMSNCGSFKKFKTEGKAENHQH